jgi:hypothetical protein
MASRGRSLEAENFFGGIFLPGSILTFSSWHYPNAKPLAWIAALIPSVAVGIDFARLLVSLAIGIILREGADDRVK